MWSQTRGAAGKVPVFFGRRALAAAVAEVSKAVWRVLIRESRGVMERPTAPCQATAGVLPQVRPAAAGSALERNLRLSPRQFCKLRSCQCPSFERPRRSDLRPLVLERLSYLCCTCKQPCRSFEVCRTRVRVCPSWNRALLRGVCIVAGHW